MQNELGMDQVFIRDLLARGILGVYDWERHEPRPIRINLVFFTDLHKAGESDDIADCVDYAAAAGKVQAFVESTPHHTVEALAASIARVCLEIPMVHKVRVIVEKPGAVHFARSVGVEIERQR